MTTIALNLQAVRDRIARAADACGRSAAGITLLAVSKTFPPSYIERAANAGQTAFGESYVQEAVKKITALPHLELDWHYIGPLQSNKTRTIAERFDWVHAIDREKIAERLNAARPGARGRLDVCIQVNVSGEGSKSGVAPGEEARIAEALMALPHLRLRGLMAIPEPTPDVALQRRRYALLRTLSERLQAAGYPLDTLSMGMSDDLEAAIAEGATIVRVGTAIFGARETL
ncbi:MAG TPA: YggS family pyridoxal phosphate-dependent enzyme [Burkholderiales bacterium]|nr:YggS family pyridoxal phosphate-dependent enzyme [Burkholderiales bacterium]